MSNNILTIINQESNTFDFLINLPKNETIDLLPKYKAWLKNQLEIVEEATKYIAEDNSTIYGAEYELTHSIVEAEKSEYNPNFIFSNLKNLDVEIQKDFLNNVKITKKDFTNFCKKHELKERDFSACLIFNELEKKEKITLKLKK